jgi:ABC-type multidrug transport system ATPase subunit
MIGLGGRNVVGNFTTYASILFCFAMLMNQQMAVFASFATESQLQVFGACTLFFAILFSGFIIPLNTIPVYYEWIFWWNPFAWAYNAMVMNEVYSGRWENPEALLRANGFVYANGEVFTREWIGWSITYMVIYFLVCCVLTALGLTYGGRSSGVARPVKKPIDDDEDEVVQDPNSSGRLNIPFTPLTLAFQDLCYEVKASTSNERLMLLKNVNGVFRPGRMCALMGTSGAGKTTLMDVIALRKQSGITTGNVYLNGFPQDGRSFRRSSGYVEQFDVQSPELTVRETVVFSARLRLDPNVVEDDKKKLEFCDQILKEVELSSLEGSLVGTDETGGLSFEQKKRLSIAVELAASPSVLFLDEPTSGLDARSALLVVRLLRKISNGGRTCVATIHQPSSTVFEMFDDLLLLKKGGQVVYHGELGKDSRTLINYFESRSATPIELGDNPANWVLRALQDTRMGDHASLYKESGEFERLQGELVRIKEDADPTEKISYESGFAAERAVRQLLVNNRLRTIYWRSPTYNLGRIMISLVLACSLGAVFITERRITTYTEADARARISVIFFGNIIVGIMSIISVQPVMTWIRDMFYRHRFAGMYGSWEIGFALGTAESFFICSSAAIFAFVFILASGLGFSVTKLAAFWGFFALNSALFSYFGQLFVCAVKSNKTAMILSGVYIGFNNLFSGLIILPQQMIGTPYALTFYITPGHYVFEGEVTSIMSNNARNVEASVGSAFNRWMVLEGNCSLGQQPCVGTQGDYIEYFFGGEFDPENVPRNFLILGLILSFVRLFTWVALEYIKFSD